MNTRVRHAIAAILMLLAISSASAKTPVDEERLRQLESELRCLVCQNQSLADSSSGLAQDLRQQVRAMMEDDKTDQQIRDYLVARYGDFVLYKPPVKSTTMLLWAGPFGFLLLAVGIGIVLIRRGSRGAEASALAEEDATGEALWQQEQAHSGASKKQG